GTPAEETVFDKDAHKPTVNKPGSGETNVTGKGKAGTPAEETVFDKDAHKPTVNKPGSGETNVTGKGT
ncbi:hypothetical protein PT077_09240, partial [Erysipelothrix rhusiopathiae]|nr:hypothetical protein [Erysipelothrix rhusiopathiae]